MNRATKSVPEMYFVSKTNISTYLALIAQVRIYRMFIIPIVSFVIAIRIRDAINSILERIPEEENLM